MATAHVQHSSLISSSFKEHMFAEETDIGGGRGGGGRAGGSGGGAPPQHLCFS